MKKTFSKTLVLATLLATTGCYFKYASSSPELKDCAFSEEGGEVVEHLFVENYGWYLFKGLPICCGDDNEENFFPLEFFTDRCTPEVVKARFDEHVRSLGDDVEAKGVTFVNTEGVTFDVPGLSFPLIVPYVLCTRDIQMSGTIVRKAKAEEVKE